MARRWYLRNGRRTSEATVRAAQRSAEEAKRTGKMGNIPCSIQPAVARGIRDMTVTEFAQWSGCFTWRD
ncbi:MAG: hypothetical protein WC683_06845 [bacterium]